jgi:hypothetical protein
VLVEAGVVEITLVVMAEPAEPVVEEMVVEME